MRRAPALALLTGLVVSCASVVQSASAAEGLVVEVRSATVDENGRHLVLDARLTNGHAADILVLVSEPRVFEPASQEASCTPDSELLGGPPALQLRSPDATPASACAGEPRPPSPRWQKSVLRLEPGASTDLLLTVQSQGAWTLPLTGQLSFGWAPATESGRGLVRRAFDGGRGLYLTGRPAVTPPGGGRKVARVFASRGASEPVSIAGRTQTAD